MFSSHRANILLLRSGPQSSPISHTGSTLHKAHKRSEADTLIICHIDEVQKLYPEYTDFDLVSLDTDVLMLS